MLLVLLACNGDKESAASVTWEDISPILERSCVSCHSSGGVGKGDFTTYENASPKAAVISAFVQGNLMPPPSMDPECRPYVGHERMNLSEEERELIAAWASEGGEEGNPVEPLIASIPSLSGSLTESLLPVAHSVAPEADGNYHCQIIENPFRETTFITGFDVVVDQPAVVHHTVLVIDIRGDAGESSGDSDLSDGWDCATPIVEPDWSVLHAWAPGMEPTEFGKGLGMRIEPGDQLVLQLHYFGDSDAIGTLDQSGYRFQTASSVTEEIYMEPLGPTNFTLPADEVSSPSETLVNNYGVDVLIHGVVPHMHKLGVGYHSSIEQGGSETCLANADDWDFGHQATYLYEEPVLWKKGQTMTNTCTFDNTSANPEQYNSPPKDVSYGEGTNQEMCFFLYYYSY